jgi:hypothetical protein
VAQLPPPHDAQPPQVPLTVRVAPLPPLLKAKNREMARAVAVLPQATQSAGASA